MKRTTKKLGVQRLESRNLLAGDVGLELMPTDVNGDGETTALDALAIINVLNAQRESNPVEDLKRYDVNGDGKVSPLDALVVINALRSNRETLVATPQRSGDGPLQTFFAQLGQRDDASERSGLGDRSGLRERLQTRLADRDVDPAVSELRETVKEAASDREISEDERASIQTLTSDLVAQGVIDQAKLDGIQERRAERRESRGDGSEDRGVLKSTIQDARADGEVSEAERASIREALQAQRGEREAFGRRGQGRFGR